MRTNVVLDDGLLKEAMKYSVARTKRGVLHEAMATYVAVKSAEKRCENYQARLARLRMRLAKGKPRTPARDIIRGDRDRAS